MSARFYPRFVKGNPQLRIFLPDWKMVMIKPDKAMPPNIVTFRVDPRMTDWDIRNYLEKIYKVGVAAINSRICPGELRKSREGVIKGEDYKIAHVSLPVNQIFRWPELFPKEKFEEAKEEYEAAKKEVEKLGSIDPDVKVPRWFL